MATYDQQGVSLWLGEQLLARATEAYEAPLPRLSSFLLVPPSDGGAPMGATAIERSVMNLRGRAQIVGNATDDLPLADVGLIRDVYPIVMLGVHIRWTIRELRAAMMSGLPLEARKLDAARRAIMDGLNRLFFFGDIHAGVRGFLRSAEIPRLLVPASDVSEGANPDVVLGAILGMVFAVSTNTGDTEAPDTIGLPPSIYNYVALTRSSTLNNDTLLTALQRMAPGVSRILSVPEFEQGGPTGGRVMAALSTGPDRAEHVIPDMLTVLQGQERNLATYVPVIAESAGFVTEFPRAHVIAEIVEGV